MLGVLNSETDSAIVADVALSRWSCCAHAPGAITHPEQLESVACDWISAAVPGTVADALRTHGRWDFQQPSDIEARDWWYRSRWTVPDDLIGQPCALCFEGLATLAEVWLNGERLFSADNMFREYRLDVSQHLQTNNELVIGFRSLSEDLQKKRPRPRWKTNLVNHQQLRWHRTTLLGHIPGWSPPVPAIGPWRDIRFETSPVSLSDVHLTTRLEGASGVVTLRARVHSASPVEHARLRVGSHECRLRIEGDAQACVLTGEISVENVPVWWPHTHGEQPLFPCDVIVEAGSDRHVTSCGKVGFRELRVDAKDGFAVHLNGEPIYCRGACWTVSDIFTLTGTEESLGNDLKLARDAGVNMLRVGGTMVYESNLFYRLCDELGILVWQDFMFANMDYPDDECFANSIAAEAIQQLQRLASHPSVVAYCGNSEIEQQAAMLGMPRELWRNTWFGEKLPALCSEHHPNAAYVPSTPSGGVLPFQPRSGICHYYGVGAYLRSPVELRKADVKFTPECLGFANVPEPEMVNEITNGALPVIHHPRWKQRVPRDTGAGWDFEDVRDHYLRELYGVDPVQLRSFDMNRYLELSRLASGEMMAQAFAEWRSGHSRNQGALVWFFKDLWPGAGWGVVDSSGVPKAAYYFLKRMWGGRQVTLTDEGLNGVDLHIINETADPFDGQVEVLLLKEPNIVVARQEAPVELTGRSRQSRSADEILGGFYDVSYAYRFGPPHHDVVVATLRDAKQNIVSEAFHFIRRREPARVPTVVLDAVAEMTNATECKLTLTCDRFLHNVRLSAKGFRPDDNYFHLLPQRTKVVTFSAVGNPRRDFKADVEALNLEIPVTIALSKSRV